MTHVSFLGWNKYIRRPATLNAPGRSRAGRSGMADPCVRPILSFRHSSADLRDGGAGHGWQRMRPGERGRCRFFSQTNFLSFSGWTLAQQRIGSILPKSEGARYRYTGRETITRLLYTLATGRAPYGFRAERRNEHVSTCELV
jgi:hypothetical protein